jgi:hypothetical protein
MKLCLIVTVTALALGAPSAPAQSERADSLALRAAVDILIDSVERAVLHKDVDGITHPLTDSAVIQAWGKTVRGRENARAWLEYFMTRFVDVSLNVFPDRLEGGSDSVRLAGDAIYTLKWPMIDPRQWHVTFSADLLHADSGGWQISSVTVPRPEPDSTIR